MGNNDLFSIVKTIITAMKRENMRRRKTHMKKKFLAMLMASVMVLGLAACGGGAAEAPAEA